MSYERILQKRSWRKREGMSMVRKVREFKRELVALGFIKLPKRGKGDHEMWRHPVARITIEIDGQDSDDIHHYNENQLRIAKSKLDGEGA